MSRAPLSPAASVGDAYRSAAFAPRPAAREAVDADVTPTAGADATVRTPTVANERPVPHERVGCQEIAVSRPRSLRV